METVLDVKDSLGISCTFCFCFIFQICLACLGVGFAPCNHLAVQVPFIIVVVLKVPSKAVSLWCYIITDNIDEKISYNNKHRRNQ